MGNILTDHALGLDTKVTKCCKTLASNLCSASSSVTTNVVQELEDKEHHKKNVLLLNVLEPHASNSEADCNYVSKLCKDAFLILMLILKAFCLGKKVLNRCRPLLVQFEKENAKANLRFLESPIF